MDELINMVAQKTGLPEDKARQAAETVIGFLKDRLPAPIAGQIDNALNGGGGGKGGASGLADKAGGMFGGKK